MSESDSKYAQKRKGLRVPAREYHKPLLDPLRLRLTECGCGTGYPRDVICSPCKLILQVIAKDAKGHGKNDARI